MKSNSVGKSLISVAFSRMVSLFSSVAVGLVLPKIFSVTDYGYFKVFTLYAAYTALLHFGFVDGVLLKLAGRDYSELNHKKIRGYTKFFILFQFLIACILTHLGFMFIKGEYGFIVLMLAINMLFVNITTYYQFISQATQRFAEYSAKNIIVSVVKIVFIAILFALDFFKISFISYKAYLIGLNIIDGAMLLWYVFIYKDITFGDRTRFTDIKCEIVSIFKCGIILTVAYQVSHLILALDRQFVNILYSTEEFAVYSFAYNIVSMISTMISSLSIVLLPMLKKAGKEYIVGYYKKSLVIVSAIVGASLVCYFPLVVFLKWFLPDYTASLEFIRIVLPSLLFTSAITVVMFTVDKVLDKNISFFKNGCVVLILGFVTNTLAYLIFRTPQSISYASLVTMAIWFLIEGVSLGRVTDIKVYKEFLYILLLALGFLSVTACINSIWLSAIVYIIFFIALTLIMYYSFFKAFIIQVKNNRHTK